MQVSARTLTRISHEPQNWILVEISISDKQTFISVRPELAFYGRKRSCVFVEFDGRFDSNSIKLSALLFLEGDGI